MYLVTSQETAVQTMLFDTAVLCTGTCLHTVIKYQGNIMLKTTLEDTPAFVLLARRKEGISRRLVQGLNVHALLCWGVRGSRDRFSVTLKLSNPFPIRELKRNFAKANEAASGLNH